MMTVHKIAGIHGPGYADYLTEKLFTATCCEMIDRLANHRSISRPNSFQAFAAAVEGHALTFRKSLDM